MKIIRTAVILLMVVVSAAWITPKTITLAVPGMTCATCPITIKAALKKVPGVTNVTVSYESLEAVVTFDDAKTNTAALIKATTEAGYPSIVKPAKPVDKRTR